MTFKFKQFTIKQDQCAMKIGTDAVLLGAWVSLKNKPKNILDIGAGTGVLALQLAQRSIAETIDAIEVNDTAFEQCVENFEASPWADRLYCYHASAQEFYTEINETYDLIISNPPFYTDNYKPKNIARNTARFTETLPFKDLVKIASKLLSEKGVFALILPKKEEEQFVLLASEAGLFLKRVCHVKGTTSSKVKRSLLEFSFQKNNVKTEELTLEITRHHYTKQYTNLVKDFYLKM